MFVDQQREAMADVHLALDFLRYEYADVLGSNYSDLNSVPLMLARIRRARHRQPGPAQPEVRSPGETQPPPAANAVEPTPPAWRHRRRRRRRGGIQQPVAVTLSPPSAVSRRGAGDLELTTDLESAKSLTTEVTGLSTFDPEDDKLEDELGEDLVDERNDYAERLLKIAHGLHYGSILILGVFVVQVKIVFFKLF